MTDTRLARFTDLTTVSMPIYEFGRGGSPDRGRGRRGPPETLLPHAVVPRSTTARRTRERSATWPRARAGPLPQLRVDHLDLDRAPVAPRRPGRAGGGARSRRRPSCRGRPGRPGSGEPVGHVVAQDALARALELALEVGVPPDVVGVDDHPDRGGSKRSAMSLACASVTTTERSTIIIGCSGSMARRTPASDACGNSRSMPSSTARRAARQVTVRARPQTSTSTSVPSAAASSTARRLSASRSRRPAASGAAKNPPRHRLDTRSPASAISARPLGAGVELVAPDADPGRCRRRHSHRSPPRARAGRR